MSNYNSARNALIARLDEMGHLATAGRVGAQRKAMVGSGMRGDKVRTIRIQADEAIDHATGKRIRASDYLSGQMDKLW